jgi:hypothetical protein
MPRVPSAEDIDQILENIDPSTLRDASHFRAIIAANDVIAAGERALIQSVIAARSAGDSWTLIGAALGVSKQAASERFGKAVRAVRSDAA